METSVTFCQKILDERQVPTLSENGKKPRHAQAAPNDSACLALFAEQSKRTSAASLAIFGASAWLSGAETFPYLLGASLATLGVAAFILDRGARAAAAGDKEL